MVYVILKCLLNKLHLYPLNVGILMKTFFNLGLFINIKNLKVKIK